MKQQNTFLYILRLAITLLLITAIMAGALAMVNKITAPRIAQLRAEKVQKAVSEVLPGGGEEVYCFVDGTGLVTNVYASDLGYAVQVAPIGFDNAITMMVGVDRDGNILGISIISHTETAGLGAVAAADTPAGQTFRGYFEGASGSVSVTKDGGTVEAITGATITSRAICVGVNAALACAATLG